MTSGSVRTRRRAKARKSRDDCGRRGKHADRRRQDLYDRMVRLLPRLRRVLCLVTSGSVCSEDLVQETYLRALTHLDTWQPGTRLDSWMLRIAQNLWIDHMRAEKTRGNVIDIDLVGDLLICDGRIVAENRLTLREVRRNIAQLSIEQRIVLKLICEDGLSYKETSEILKLPAGTVMSRLARARDALLKSRTP